jgi:hypothetical protein
MKGILRDWLAVLLLLSFFHILVGLFNNNAYTACEALPQGRFRFSIDSVQTAANAIRDGNLVQGLTQPL